MRNLFDLARQRDFDDEVVVLSGSILPKMLECWMKICTVPLHDFSATKLNCLLAKLGRMC